jgi:hypothetical protein
LQWDPGSTIAAHLNQLTSFGANQLTQSVSVAAAAFAKVSRLPTQPIDSTSLFFLHICPVNRVAGLDAARSDQEREGPA